MFELDPVTIATIANDASQTVLQAGPPADLPAQIPDFASSQVPDFVSNILETVNGSAGEGGLGETVSGLTPGGQEAATGGEEVANEVADGAGSVAGESAD